MKKRILLTALVILCLSLLTACGCNHEWTNATCETPKTCSLCGETEGEALGHSWMGANCETAKTCSVCAATDGDPLGHTWNDATCASPKTCTVCSATEGEALAHTFSDWTLSMDTASRTCSVCSQTETADPGVYFETALIGHWNFTYLMRADGAMYAAESPLNDMYYVDWGENNQATFKSNHQTFSGEMRFHEFVEPDYYWYLFLLDDDRASRFVYCAGGDYPGLYYVESEDLIMIFQKDEAE